MENVNLKFNEKGLIVVVTQDVVNGEVLMQAYMNEDALKQTIESGYATYFSRSRNCLWKKGETSGHFQKVVAIKYDCDEDCLLLQVEQVGSACHTGNRTCFHRDLIENNNFSDYKIIFSVFDTIKARKENPVEGSYTNYLFDKGIEKICKKIGEEATETVIAAVADKKDELTCELADLFYHCSVLMEEKNISAQDVFNVLMQREGLAPNKKYAK